MVNPQPKLPGKSPPHPKMNTPKLHCSLSDTSALKQDILSHGSLHENSCRLTDIRPGFCMFTFRVEPEAMSNYSFDIEDLPPGFAFCLQGEQHITYHRSSGKKPTTVCNKGGINCLSGLRQIKGHGSFLPHTPHYSVSLLIDPEQLATYLTPEIDCLPETCWHFCQNRPSMHVLPMTPEMHHTAGLVFRHGEQGGAERLRLETLALELLALQLDQLTANAFSHQKDLVREDIERIRAAAHILAHNLKEPPTAHKLSRMVGINESKLRKGFKQIFGTTLYQFLSAQRMHYAREMIVSKEMDVSQAALSVGYTSISQFIISYKKTFGCTPGRHKIRSRNHFPPLPINPDCSEKACF